MIRYLPANARPLCASRLGTAGDSAASSTETFQPALWVKIGRPQQESQVWLRGRWQPLLTALAAPAGIYDIVSDGQGGLQRAPQAPATPVSSALAYRLESRWRNSARRPRTDLGTRTSPASVIRRA